MVPHGISWVIIKLYSKFNIKGVNQMQDKLYATGVIYDEDGSVREIFQHDNEKDVHDMMAYVLSISSKNLRSEYIGRINGAYKNGEGKTYHFEKGKFIKTKEWRQ